MRQLTIPEAIKELDRRYKADAKKLNSSTWRAKNGSVYSWTTGHADAIHEIIVMLETNYTDLPGKGGAS